MGRAFRPKCSYTRKDGTRVEKLTEAWYIEYTDAHGRWIRRKAGTTKEQAKDALRKAESDVLAIKNGLPTERVGDMLCTKLASEYLLIQKPHISEEYYAKIERQTKEMFAHCRAYSIRDLTPEKVEGFLETLRRRKKSARTINTYIQSIKGMLNWAVENRKLPYNPLDCIRKRSETEDRRKLRRALTDDEISRLMAAAADGPARRLERAYKSRSFPPKLQAEIRAQADRNLLIYQLFLETGLRFNEARLLAWSDIDLGAGTFTTRPWWEGNKNGKEETLPLSPGLQEKLRALPEPRTGVVVHIPAQFLRTFNDDIEAAGIPKIDAAGRVMDVHALRHTFGTRLVAAGVDIKSVQKLMRHSTPLLTLGIYVHSDKARLAQAIATLPRLPVAATPLQTNATQRKPYRQVAAKDVPANLTTINNVAS